jgi:hypothetical protein
MHGDTKDLVKKAVMDDHSNECSGGEQRIHFAKGAFADSGLDVGSEVVVKDAVVFPEEHVRQFMTFERAE